MARYIAKRVLMLIPVMLGISLVVLILIDITPEIRPGWYLAPRPHRNRWMSSGRNLGLTIPFRYDTGASFGACCMGILALHF